MTQIFNSYSSREREFSQAPFWFWNDELSETEISRQLDDFQAHGIHAFVIHPRAGLPRSLGWMSDGLLRYMRFAIEEAARRDMWVILYDEAMYPSGSSAGQVVAENPSYACRALVQVDLTVATPGEQIQGISVGRSGVELTDQQTLVAVVTRQHDQHRIAIVDRPINSTIRGVHFVEDDPPRRDDHTEVDENHPPAGDLLNPEAMQYFIRNLTILACCAIFRFPGRMWSSVTLSPARGQLWRGRTVPWPNVHPPLCSIWDVAVISMSVPARMATI